MSLRDYNLSRQLEGDGVDPRSVDWGEDFYALIMLAMRHGDTENVEKLKAAWPGVWAELSERYNAPRGLLPGERDAEGWSRVQGGLTSPDGEFVRAV